MFYITSLVSDGEYLPNNGLIVTISELYNNSVKLVAAANIPEPELEVSLLLGYVLNKSRAELVLFGNEKLTEKDIQVFNQYLAQRLDRIPLAYVIGEQEFWSMSFTVTPHVLIPRPETEQLLDLVFQTIKKEKKQPEQIVDLGTGSGVIATLLAMKFPGAKVVAVDLSMAALRVACENFHRHNLSHKILPLCASWGEALKNGMWDVVVSNPPYVAHEAMANLELEVRTEPDSALDGGEKGMDEINQLAKQLDQLLKPQGWFFMEIGFDQKEFVLDLFNSMPYFSNVIVHNDYAGLPRMLQARKKG